jgi:hypothetical protein
MEGNGVIVIMKKDDHMAWIFNISHSYLFIKYNGKLEMNILNKEEVRNKIIELSKQAWEVVKNIEEW